MGKSLIIIFAFILLISLASAAQETLGTFKQGSCISLLQNCGNCTYVNISSVLYPNGTKALSEVPMTKINMIYNYTYCLTSLTGDYVVSGHGNPDGVIEVYAYDFKVTYTGTEFTTSQAITYFILLVVLCGLFLFCVYNAFTIPWMNEKNELGEIIQINYRKYLKMFAAVWSYIFLIWISYFGYTLSLGFLQIYPVAMFFRAVFYLMMALIIPLIISISIISLIVYINDKKIQSYIERGLPTNAE